jgi:hypothetical protein
LHFARVASAATKTDLPSLSKVAVVASATTRMTIDSLVRSIIHVAFGVGIRWLIGPDFGAHWRNGMKRDEQKDKKKLTIKRDLIRTLTNDALNDVVGGRSTTSCGQTMTCTCPRTKV